MSFGAEVAYDIGEGAAGKWARMRSDVEEAGSTKLALGVDGERAGHHAEIRPQRQYSEKRCWRR